MLVDMSLESNLKILKALSEESRYRIVEVLLGGEKCACQLPDLIGRTQSNTSMQLTKLTSLGILKSRRDGKKIIYSIKDQRVCDVFKSLGYPEGKLLKSCHFIDRKGKEGEALK
jgi:ArsR family transcriptional regulator, lead/cadmium/zinc/bismuth-responsive transcriptional repressor